MKMEGEAVISMVRRGVQIRKAPDIWGDVERDFEAGRSMASVMRRERRVSRGREGGVEVYAVL